MTIRGSQEHGKEIASIKQEMTQLEALPSFDHALLIKSTAAMNATESTGGGVEEEAAPLILPVSTDDDDNDDGALGGLGLFDVPPADDTPVAQSTVVVKVHDFDFRSWKGASVVSVLAEWCRKNIGATIGLFGLFLLDCVHIK